jgi:hypothetical protein
MIEFVVRDEQRVDTKVRYRNLGGNLLRAVTSEEEHCSNYGFDEQYACVEGQWTCANKGWQ